MGQKCNYKSNQKRGGTTLRSHVYRLLVPCERAPSAQYTLTITSNSKVVRPPYKKHGFTILPKKRYAALHCQKRLQGRV